MGSTCKGPVARGWDALQEQQTGFGGWRGACRWGPSLDQQPTPQPPRLSARSEHLQSGKQEALHRTGPGMAKGAGAGVFVQDSAGPERKKVPEPSLLVPQTAEQPSGPSTGLLPEFRACSSGRDDPQGSGWSPHGQHVKGLRAVGAALAREIKWASWRSRRRTGSLP